MMRPYIGCDYARERLEALIDGELTVDEQVAIESHVRWCQTCVARIEDMRLIGASVRTGSPVSGVMVDPSAIRSHVVLRLRAEGEQALAVRIRALFVDLRLLWPALGATLAVVFCVGIAFGVLNRASAVRPESLAMMIESVANPGSERNPLRPDNRARVDSLFAKYVDSNRAGGISMPRVAGDGAGLESMPNGDATFTMATVVSREGRIADYWLLSERSTPATALAEQAGDLKTVLDAVRLSRFAPAETPGGRPVAVNMVWMIFYTTVRTAAPSGPVLPAAGTPPPVFGLPGPAAVAPAPGAEHVAASPTA